MTTYKTTITEITTHPEQVNPIYAGSATRVRLEDEGGGAFIVLQQNDQKVCLDPEELPLVMAAAQQLLSQPIGESTD
jgi:hypothetical protein